ncbi:MAG: hypothetical protein IT368_10830 [Candidatus Hydrogenedentes bacterium]|nr:hypothetical protein [Candidatus Hydrogenedentota bacterium]
MRNTWIGMMAAVAGTVLSLASTAQAQTGDPGRNAPLQIDARIYQVLTNVTGNGLTSQTLTGPQGWYQVIHQQLDTVDLVMDGATLTWNGEAEPGYDRIIPLARPSLITSVGVAASLAIGSPGVEYMEPAADGLFALKDAPEDAGLNLSFTPESVNKQTGIVSGKLNFDFIWVKNREKIEGVNLDVGKPIMGQAAAVGAVQLRLGEWSCYQVPVESEGWIYVFVRVTEKTGSDTSPGLSLNDKDLGGTLKEKPHASGGPTPTGPKIEVGGSVRIRGNYYSNQ